MPELNLKQIKDKLNAEFAGDTRKLIFWYDEKAEFVEDIDSLELDRAIVYHLEPHNQFYTKYFLERVDKNTNYLIYAPFAKPHVRDNHLQDTLLYSKQFFADRASLLTVDLGIDEKYKQVIQQYIKFFASKERTQKFYDLELENFTRESIEIGLMSVICKTKVASFEEVLKVILDEERNENNRFLSEFEKFDLSGAFWRLCETQFGFVDVSLTLEKLLLTLFVTYTQRYFRGKLPESWGRFVSFKAGNIIAFVDDLMNSVLYREAFDEISEEVALKLNASKVFNDFAPEAILDCDNFLLFDQIIVAWILERLLLEDVGARIGDLFIPEVCQLRLKKHFGKRMTNQYNSLLCAFKMISRVKYTLPDDLKGIIKQYRESDYLFDSAYREFYLNYDLLSDSANFEKLRDLIENIYTTEFLAKQLPKWNEVLYQYESSDLLTLQRNFFKNFVQNRKDRVVVIISDGLRYETGCALFQKLKDDVKCTVKLDAMMAVLPSFTRLGMAALLPHKKLEITQDFKVLADKLPSESTPQREAILKSHVAQSRCVQFDEIKHMKKEKLREIFTGMEVVYVYHNQIDARGENFSTESEVFIACEEAVEEIYALIKRLSVSANTYHFIVTADHGFIYKRDKLTESDKIKGVADKDAFVSRRFIISDEAVNEEGVAFSTMGNTLGNDDKRIVSYPVSNYVFKASGGQNYVHGGSSPQELIVPVIDVKIAKGHMETRPAQIKLVSLVQKITNLIANLDFIQSEPVGDVVKAASYRLFFISENNEKISNECIYAADKKDAEPGKRIFRLKFNFKNKQYDKDKKYYLVAYDEKNEIEVLRHGVVMDIAFADDFGFNV